MPRIYCLSCREKTKNVDVHRVGNQIKALCGECGTKKNSFRKMQQGDGVKESLQVIGRLISGGVKPVLNSMPAAVAATLKTHGEKTITAIKICRDPIQSVLQKIVSLVSINQPHDKLFHLYMIITLSDGTNILTERNARVVLKPSPVRSSSTSVSVSPPSGRTLNDFMNRAISRVGPRIWRYDPFQNNCQDYITSLLSANGLNTMSNFVKQDVKGMVSPFINKVGKTITDVAATAQTIVQGGSKKKKKKKQ